MTDWNSWPLILFQCYFAIGLMVGLIYVGFRVLWWYEENYGLHAYSKRLNEEVMGEKK